MRMVRFVECLLAYIIPLIIALLLLKYGTPLARFGIPILAFMSFIPIANISVVGILLIINLCVLCVHGFGLVLGWLQ
jgi:hypothetical protein